MSKTQSFLFEFARRSYEREEQGNDAILRTLPFFATSLGALLAALAVLGGHLENLPPDRAQQAYGMLGIVLGLALVAIGCVGVAVLFTRESRVIADSIQIAERVQMLDTLYNQTNPGSTAEAIDDLVLFDLRDALVQEMSIAAFANRLANINRMRWLESAIAALTASLIVAFVAMFVVLTSGTPRIPHGIHWTTIDCRPGARRQSCGTFAWPGVAAAADVGPPPVGSVLQTRTTC